jgi:hypothetical protein
MIFLFFVLAISSIMMAHLKISSESSDYVFYFLPTRIFEMLIGAIIFICFVHKKNKILEEKLINKKSFLNNKNINQALSFLGLVMIIYSIVFFTKNIPYPSFYSLIPTIGTALIIIFSNNYNLVGKFLTYKITIFIGLISYGTYLWHYPLLIFFKLNILQNFNYFEIALYVLSSLFMGYLSYKFIETPFRNKNIISSKRLIIFIVVSLIFFISFAVYIDQKKGEIFNRPEFKIYFDNIKTKVSDCHKISDDYKLNSSCREVHQDKPIVALWGDSHADSLSQGFKKLQAKNDFQLIELTTSSCPPISDVVNVPKNRQCKKINQENVDFLVKNPPQILIIYSGWMIAGEYNYSLKDLKSKFSDTLFMLKNALPNTRIIIIGPSPRWRLSTQYVEFVLFKRGQNAQPFYRTKEFLNLDSLEKLMGDIAKNHNVEYVSMMHEFCNEEGCVMRVGESADDFITYDYGHLSKNGAEYFVDKIKNKIFLK